MPWRARACVCGGCSGPTRRPSSIITHTKEKEPRSASAKITHRQPRSRSALGAIKCCGRSVPAPPGRQGIGSGRHRARQASGQAHIGPGRHRARHTAHLHDFVGATVDTLDPGIHKGTRDGVFPHVAPPAVQLHALVGNLGGPARCRERPRPSPSVPLPASPPRAPKGRTYPVLQLGGVVLGHGGHLLVEAPFVVQQDALVQERSGDGNGRLHFC